MTYSVFGGTLYPTLLLLYYYYWCCCSVQIVILPNVIPVLWWNTLWFLRCHVVPLLSGRSEPQLMLPLGKVCRCLVDLSRFFKALT